MKRILITGANSFIARNLLELLDSKYKLSTYVFGRDLLDLLDKEKVRSLLEKEKYDVIIHTATYTYDLQKMYEKNMQMFYNLFNCKDYFGKMLYFGSGAEYNRDVMPKYVNEDFYGKYPPSSFLTDPYSLSKYNMNSHIKDTNVYNLRLFATFGKYDKETRPIPSLCLQALKANSLNLKENSSYDFLYVKDICKIAEWFMEHNPIYNTYNVCSGISRSFLSIAETINSFVKEKQLPINLKDKNILYEYSGDNSRLLKELKNFKFTNFEVALKNVFEWYKEQK